ncbi:MAG: hypothetical protein JWO94_2842 [Verrucomicrobiaceae bacterium]|nr:hypothetical protein [Verrucomicrobiaceae bacterium]
MHLLEPQHDTKTDDQQPLSEYTPLRGIRNFLFLIPEDAVEPERTVVLNAARRMTEYGYVYLAEGGRKEVEDCKDVRHLPLNDQYLPAFGLINTVVVLNREDLAQLAHQTYPDAQVFLLTPVSSTAGQTEEQVVMTADHYFSCLRPWLVTGQMAAVRN